MRRKQAPENGQCVINLRQVYYKVTTGLVNQEMSRNRKHPCSGHVRELTEVCEIMLFMAYFVLGAASVFTISILLA